MISACPQYFYVGIGLPKGSPLKSILDIRMTWVHEGGIMARIMEFGGEKIQKGYTEDHGVSRKMQVYQLRL